MKSTQLIRRLVWLKALAAATTLGIGSVALAADPAAPMSDTPPAGAASDAAKTPPSPADSSDAAFAKLAAGKKFVLPDDIKALPGFEKVFAAADANHDGRLNSAEFKSAWKIYTDAEKGTRG